MTEPIPKNNTPNPNIRPQQSGAQQTDIANLDLGMLRWTRIVGVFTGVLAVLGALQCWAFIQSERAFVATSAFQIAGGDFVPDTDLILNVEIKNSGKSTGFVTELNTTVAFFQLGNKLPSSPEYKKSGAVSPGPIIANGTYMVRDEVHGLHGEPRLRLTSSDISAIKSGGVKMYVFGFVEYTDEFSLFGARKTGYCALYNPKGDTRTSFDNCADSAYTYAH